MTLPIERVTTTTSRQQQQRVLQQQQEENTAVCPPCECDAFEYASSPPPTTTTSQDEESTMITVKILLFDSQGIVDMVEWNARDFEQYKNGSVKIEIEKSPTMPELFQEIESDARTGGGLFDAYYTNPVILGTAAMLGGFMNVGPYVKTSPHADWTDVLAVFRTHVTNFEDKIYIILLDGDTHAMFYRRDVLEYFGLPVPRTWDEYIDVAKAVHGKMYEGIQLSGSCISRIAGDHALYWAHLVLATITQTQGTQQGSLFDTQDMTPLTGQAMAEMLRIHEAMAMYGTPDEFDKELNAVQNAHLNDGSCVLTYSWGDIYKRSRAQGSVVGDKIGIAPTPGCQRVMDRSTGQLVRCDKDRCPYGTFYDDIGWVNYAPYAANGGWGGAISANTSPEKQQVLAEFFLWASGKQQSQKYVIPNATLPIELINGQDPWRKSHLDVSKWVRQGYTAELAKQYVETILHNTQSKNVAVEIKFPKSGEIMSILDKEMNRYLYRAVKENSIPEANRAAERLKTSNEVTRQWNTIINAYNARGDTVAPILEIYQRLRGVYFPNQDFNQITTVRPVGYTLFAIIAVLCFVSAGWVIFRWENRVVKASQPPFLLLLCLGVLVLGSSIIPMGIDDSIASAKGCSTACVAMPWLAAIGFTVTFSALFSKLWRFNLVYKNASRFRRVVVSVQDVIKPLILLLTLNVVLLAIWTALDPPQWERVIDGRDDSGTIVSHGQCSSEGQIAMIMIILLVAVNLMALVLANIQAYKARTISSEFSESKYIGFCMVFMFQAVLVGLPVLLLARSNPTASFVVGSLLVFVCCASIQCLIFIPKYRLSVKREDDAIPTDSFRPSRVRFSSYVNQCSNLSDSVSQPRSPEQTSTSCGILRSSQQYSDSLADSSHRFVSRMASHPEIVPDAPERSNENVTENVSENASPRSLVSGSSIATPYPGTDPEALESSDGDLNPSPPLAHIVDLNIKSTTGRTETAISAVISAEETTEPDVSESQNNESYR